MGEIQEDPAVGRVPLEWGAVPVPSGQPFKGPELLLGLDRVAPRDVVQVGGQAFEPQARGGEDPVQEAP